MKTVVGLNLARDAFKGDVSDAEIKYIAWGDGTPWMDGSDTTLANEVGRKAVTDKAAGGTGVQTIIGYIDQDEAVGTITEIGLFAGAGATSTPNSGVLTDIWLYSRTKTTLEAIQFQDTDTFAEGS